nr:D-alanyl-D-alanine carboxypeptidase PBPD1 [Listeria sp. PSOL-1]
MSTAFLAVTVAASGIFVSPKVSLAAGEPDVNANAAMAIEASTGKILYKKNSDQLMGIASMTKTMDEYLLFERINNGKLKWDDKVTISDYAHEVSQDRTLSNVPLRNGEKYTVKELYEAMAIYSANGAAIALAEKIAGSEAKFVEMMNKKATQLKLGKHKFVNATGLNNSDLKGKEQVGSKNDENQMTAQGMALLAKKLIQKYPDVLKTASITKKDFRPNTSDRIAMSNWNWLLPGLIYGRKGVDGLKTGTTDYAGMCLTATAQQNGMRVITVVLHANGGKGKGSHNSARFDETNKMLDYAFNNFKVMDVESKKAAVKNPATIDVSKGKSGTADLVTAEAAKLVVPKATDKPQLDKKVILDKKEVEAPVKGGTEVGNLTIKLKGGDNLGYIDGSQTAKVPVVTKETIEEANWFVSMLHSIGSFFSGIGSYVADGVMGWFN